MTDGIDADQVVERTDTGVSITTKLTRGTGTRDQDVHTIKAKGHTFADAASKHASGMAYLGSEVLDQARGAPARGRRRGGRVMDDPTDDQLRAATEAHRALSRLRETDLDGGADAGVITALEALDGIVLELALARWEDDA